MSTPPTSPTATIHPANYGLNLYLLDTRPWPRTFLSPPSHPSHPSSLLPLLPHRERIEVLRFRQPADQLLALGSRLLRRWAVVRSGVCGWREAHFGVGNGGAGGVGEGLGEGRRGGKPVLLAGEGEGVEEEREGFGFNVSHSAGLVVCVSGRGPEGMRVRVGVDIEKIDRAEEEFLKPGGLTAFLEEFEGVFSERELRSSWASYREDGDLVPRREEVRMVIRGAYMLWTVHEAYGKMLGVGLLEADGAGRIELDRVVSLPPDGETLRLDGRSRAFVAEHQDMTIFTSVLEGEYMMTCSFLDFEEYSVSDMPPLQIVTLGSLLLHAKPFDS